MREILFRGKRHNGEWYYGSYLFLCVPPRDWKGDTRGNAEPVHYIINEKDINYAAAPETVGQFTGLTDKNGKKIFEGDICRVGNLLYKVEFRYSCWRFTILSSKVYCCPAFNSHCGDLCEVIGNIHDNPELLGGAEDD